jgi:hypothetical protein
LTFAGNSRKPGQREERIQLENQQNSIAEGHHGFSFSSNAYLWHGVGQGTHCYAQAQARPDAQTKVVAAVHEPLPGDTSATDSTAAAAARPAAVPDPEISPAVAKESRPREVEMIEIAVVTVLCAAGVAFYVRFFIALGCELRYAQISYLVRVQPSVTEVFVIAPGREKAPVARAA